jgi:signal transduction histidine kinase
VRPIAEAKAIGLRAEGASEGIVLRTDARKFCQILVNLLGNAVKFTAAGEVVLQVRVDGEGADGTLHCEVTDTGPGIAEEDQAHVFDAFWQADRRSAQSLGGTGLGLPVARQLARALGGEVRIARSEPGHGSTFEVSLPMTDAEVAVAR